MQRLDMLHVVLQQHGFGDFQLQALRRQAGLVQRFAEIVERAGLAKLHGRQIDADLDMRRPADRVAARLA